MNILDILLPTIVFTICSLLTVPILRLIRRTKIDPQKFMVIWILITFSVAGLGLFRIATEYFGQSQSFIQICSTDTIFGTTIYQFSCRYCFSIHGNCIHSSGNNYLHL